jgi:hypothetical protein
MKDTINVHNDIEFVAQLVFVGAFLIACLFWGIDFWRSKKKSEMISISNFYITKGWFGPKKILADTDQGRIVIPAEIYDTRLNSKIKILRVKCEYYEGRITGRWYSTKFSNPRKK